MIKPEINYLWLEIGGALPVIKSTKPIRAVMIIEQVVDNTAWRDAVCDWMVSNRCLYVMTWGHNCEDWHDDVDAANLKRHDFGENSDGSLIMTTWHENESLDEVFWFADKCASHPKEFLNSTLLIHISKIDKQQIFLKKYYDAIQNEN